MFGARVMAVDAAFTHVGVAVVELGVRRQDDRVLACVCVKTEKSAARRNIRVADDDAERCIVIYKALEETAAEYGVAALVAELPGGSQSARSAKTLGMATAILACFSQASGLPSVWTTPDKGKLAFTGTKTASKDDMINKACSLWGPTLPFKRDGKGRIIKDSAEHVADALAAFEAAAGDSIIKMLRGTIK